MSICFRIYTTNYIDIDELANNYFSSEQSAFPVTNIYNKQRRSKVWRSNGYFEVTSSNNQIVFEETVSTPLTATIAVGEYASITAMQTAIKTALEATGASTYTVTQDNYRFKITSDGAGGGGIFNLLTSDAGFTSADLLGFDTAADRTGSLNYTADFIRIHSSEWIKWDLGISTNPTSFALIGKRNEPIQISPSATIKLQGNETDNWTSPSYEQSLTYDDEIMSIVSDNGLHTEALRYWRLLIIDRNNPNGYVEVGSLLLGDYFNPPRGRPQFAFQSQLVDRSETIFSEGGQSFTDIREQTQEYGVNWLGLQKADIEEFETFFEEFGIGIPFFVSFDTDEVFSTNRNRRFVFVKFADSPNWSLETPDNFTLSTNFREEL